MVRTWFRGKVPKIGVEGQITGGPHKSDQFPIRLIEDADLPQAALKGEVPASSGWVDSPQDISRVLSCFDVGGVDVSSRVPSGKGGIEGC